MTACFILLLLKCTLYALCTQKVNILRTSVQCHIASMTVKNDKHTTVLCMQLFSLCKCGVINENNRSYLENNQYVGENNRANF